MTIKRDSSRLSLGYSAINSSGRWNWKSESFILLIGIVALAFKKCPQRYEIEQPLSSSKFKPCLFNVSLFLLLNKMKVTDHLRAAKEPLFSFEILPPLKGKSIQSIFNGIDPLMEFKPKFINVTYHREEFIYKERENGLLEKIAIRKRPGTVGICAAIMNKYQVDAVPHLICGGFSREETENALIDLQFLGIDNVLALRGDSIKTEANFRPHPEGHAHAVDLIQQISDMNKGSYMMDDVQLEPTHFCVGAAGYPEKHFEAMNMSTDLHYLKEKVFQY